MIEIRDYDFGSLKVLIHSYGDLAREENLARVAEYNGIHLYSIMDVRNSHFRDTEFYNTEWSREAIEAYAGHPLIRELYRRIEEIIRKEKIRIFVWLGDPGVLSKAFLKTIQKMCYVAFWTFDDPVNSEKIVRHCAAAYDCGFTAAVNWDRTLKTAEKFREWGCPRAFFIPIGVFEGKYRRTSNFSERKYDLVFVGSVFQDRLLFMFRLKKHFGKRMLIFGRGWNGENLPWHKKVLLTLLKRYYRVPRIERITDEELVEYYQNSRIGINTHMTEGGPSAVRTYELPVNGVMQICDSESGLSEIFEIGREVVAYENNNAREAIKAIEYYLAHESERRTIAEAGYRRTLREYMVWHSFEKILELIYSDPIYAEAQG